MKPDRSGFKFHKISFTKSERGQELPIFQVALRIKYN